MNVLGVIKTPNNAHSPSLKNLIKYFISFKFQLRLVSSTLVFVGLFFIGITTFISVSNSSKNSSKTDASIFQADPKSKTFTPAEAFYNSGLTFDVIKLKLIEMHKFCVCSLSQRYSEC